MVGNSACEPFVRCCRQHEPTTDPLLLPEEFNEFAVEGQCLGRELRMRSDTLLESSSACHLQERQSANRVAVRQNRKNTFYQRVRKDESSVKIDTQRLVGAADTRRSGIRLRKCPR